MEHSLAIECDGDRWHGPERYQHDMARQRDLERCGWTFWRVRGSHFYVDPEQAMEGLWEILEQNGIYPNGEAPPDTVAYATTSDPTTPLQESHLPAEFAPATIETTSIESAIEEEIETVDSAIREAVTATSVERIRSIETNQSEVEQPHSVEDPQQPAVRGVFRFDAAPLSLENTPYESWQQRTLPDSRIASRQDLVAHLIDIVKTEGPMTALRACHIYVKAAGGQRATKSAGDPLYQALNHAIKQDLIEAREEDPVPTRENIILREAGTPIIRVRSLGGRTMHEVPPSELATLIQQLKNNDSALTGGLLFRAVIETYGIRRLTDKIINRLAYIEQNIARLINE